MTLYSPFCFCTHPLHRYFGLAQSCQSDCVEVEGWVWKCAEVSTAVFNLPQVAKYWWLGVFQAAACCVGTGEECKGMLWCSSVSLAGPPSSPLPCHLDRSLWTPWWQWTWTSDYWPQTSCGACHLAECCQSAILHSLCAWQPMFLAIWYSITVCTFMSVLIT